MPGSTPDSTVPESVPSSASLRPDGSRSFGVVVRHEKPVALATCTKGNEKTTPVDVARVIEFAVKLAHGEIHHRARLVRDFGAVPTVRGSEALLGQVFVALLANAAQAFAKSDPHANVIHLATDADADGNVVVEIADNGPGIPADVLPRIWDPFFTTKEVGEGTGLGLSIVHELVERQGGTIEVTTQVGAGTTFTVTLPRRAPEARRDRIPRTETKRPTA